MIETDHTMFNVHKLVQQIIKIIKLIKIKN